MSDVTSYLSVYVGETLLGEAPVDPDEELLLSGILDSLMVVRMIAHIEEQFSVKVPATDVVLDNMKSVRAIADYLERTFAVSGQS